MIDLDAIHGPAVPMHTWGSMEIAQYVRNRAARNTKEMGG